MERNKLEINQIAEIIERIEILNKSTDEILNFMEQLIQTEITGYDLETKIRFYELLLKRNELKLREQGLLK